jgi:hypothetical protein
MTYEDYLDEVTTLVVEKYGVTEATAIKIVVVAQDKEFFVAHDDNESMRTIDQAHLDARALFSASPAASTAKPAAKRARPRTK